MFGVDWLHRVLHGDELSHPKNGLQLSTEWGMQKLIKQIMGVMGSTISVQ
jgi:hypothetical protein